jgi:chromosome partitioning protein
MPFMVAMVSQKGGVGKSTLARLLAREFAAQQWRVKIADLDLSQATSFQWRSRRLAHGIEPDVAVEQFARLDQVLKIAEQYDLIVFDGAPHSSQVTRSVALASDMTVIPTGLAVDDLQPSVTLAHELVQAGVPRQKLTFALCRVGSSLPELEDARVYLQQTGYPVLAGSLPEQVAYRRASDEGRALTETRFPTLNQRAEELAQALVDTIGEISKQSQESNAAPARTKRSVA